jgi:SAM-dependent methyltransferase
VSLNYTFMADQIAHLVGPRARVLDYGCGEGQLIVAALEKGHEVYGCDTYEPGTSWGDWIDQASRNERIRLIGADGTIPFPDGMFDVVTANQVFEHIDDFERPLAEIYRVLRPGGLFINCFPTLEIWWEGHVKTPFAQRFFGSPDLWRQYLIVMYWLHLGIWRSGKTSAEWASMHSRLPSACFYKSHRQVQAAFARWFEILPSAEADWIRHRLANSRSLSWVPAPRAFDPLLRFVCSRLASRVFVLRRRAMSPKMP